MERGVIVPLALALVVGVLTSAVPAFSQQKVPIGKPRTNRQFTRDVEDLLYGRRIAHSDLLPGGLKAGFKVRGCIKCHENDPDVEGQIFYGPNFRDFGKDQETKNRAIPEKGVAPGRDYDFVGTHEKRQKLWTEGAHEQLIKQNL